jgi:zinc protease
MDRMRRNAPAAVLLGLVLLGALAAPGGGEDAASRQSSFTLDNGLRVFLYEKHDLPLLNMVTAFDVGSKDESDETSGLVHMLEHLVLFGGTTKRSGAEVALDVRRHGAYFNASTGQDNALFEISLPPENVDFALKNQREILFDFAVSPEKLEEEKSVILEEISQMEDDPERSAIDLLLRSLFEGHPYGRSVYGTRAVIQAATPGTLKGFHDRFFVPANCAMALVGDFDKRVLEAKVREVFGSLPKAEAPPRAIPGAGLLKKDRSVREERDIKEAYVAIGFAAPDFNHPDVYAMELLTEILGRGINPMLNAALNVRQDLIKTMSMSYFSNRYGGAVVILLTLDPKNAAAAARDAIAFLKRARNENFSKDDVFGDAQLFAFDYLESAKNQIRFSASQADESGLALARSVARFMILNSRENPGNYLAHIGRVKSGDLRKAVGEYFARGESVVVTLVPAKTGKQAKES